LLPHRKRVLLGAALTVNKADRPVIKPHKAHLCEWYTLRQHLCVPKPKPGCNGESTIGNLNPALGCAQMRNGAIVVVKAEDVLRKIWVPLRLRVSDRREGEAIVAPLWYSTNGIVKRTLHGLGRRRRS
jgi:hypothetical protein